MLAIEESQKLTLSNLPSLSLFTGTDQGQFEVMKSQVLRQIGYDSADLNFAYFDMKEVVYKDVELELVSLPFFADEKIVILDHFVDITTAKKRFLADDELKSFEEYLDNPSPTTKLLIFAEGKLDSKRRLVKLLKRDAKVFDAVEAKEQELRQYFQKWSQKQGLQFVILLKISSSSLVFNLAKFRKISSFYSPIRKTLLSRKRILLTLFPRPCRTIFLI